MNQERVIPIEIINGLLEFKDEHFVTSHMLNSDEDLIRHEAEKEVQLIREYLLSKDLTPEECEMYTNKSLKHTELSMDSDDGSGFSFFLVLLIISVVATGLLTWLNYYLLTEFDRIWIALIIINVLVAICVVVLLFIVLFGVVSFLGFDIPDKIKYLKKKNKMDEKDSLLSQNREYAEYLINEHNYDKDAIMFYFSDYASDYFELKAFVDKLDFPNKQ